MKTNIPYQDGFIPPPMPIEQVCAVWTELHKRLLVGGMYSGDVFTPAERSLYDILIKRLQVDAAIAEIKATG